MRFEQYRSQFIDNLKVMTRTINGVLDTTSSATKKDALEVSSGEEAQSIVLRNIEKAIKFVYDNKDKEFSNSDELGDFMIQVAKIVNDGIVKDGQLFRSGADSAKYKYVKIADVEKTWNEFCNQLYELMCYPYKAVCEIAHFTEYMINGYGHFFADGCGKISLFISSFICLRYESDLPVYKSRDEYYEYMGPLKELDLDGKVGDSTYYKSLRYYRTLFKETGIKLDIEIDEDSADKVVLKPIGSVVNDTLLFFKGVINFLSKRYPNRIMEINCHELQFITTSGTDVLEKYKNKGVKFVLTECNQDVYVALLFAGIEDMADKPKKIREISVDGLKKIGEGSNGVVYRVDDEQIIKTFKRKPNFDDIINERILMKSFLISDILSPISMGFVYADGKIALLMELLDAKSLLDLIRLDKSYIEKYINTYVKLVKSLHKVQGDALMMFPRRKMETSLMEKAERVESYLGEKYHGVIQKVIESVNEPEVLIHGDIQPANVLLSDEAYFIDLDTATTGPALFDLCALYRTMFSGKDIESDSENLFLKIPYKTCEILWREFLNRYYEGESKEYIAERERICRVIGNLLATAKIVKCSPQNADKVLAIMKDVLDKDCL